MICPTDPRNHLPINNSNLEATHDSIMTFQQSCTTLPFDNQFPFPCGAATGFNRTSTFCSSGLLGQHLGAVTGLNDACTFCSGGLLGQHLVEQWDDFLLPCGAVTGLNDASTFCSGGLLAGQHAIEGWERDEFLMYTFKVRRCMWNYPHLWSECPFAHPGETAQRRDPRKFPDHGIACVEFRRTGNCRWGQKCWYGHGIFEFWLHPTRYHTYMCEDGLGCTRPFCFFAHTVEQLRPEVIHDCFHSGESKRKTATARARARARAKAAAVTAVAAASSSSVGGRGAGDGDDEPYDLPHIDLMIEELLR